MFLIVLKAFCAMFLVAQSSPTLYDPTDCSLPGSSVHGILQARILQWVAMPSSRGSSQPRDWTPVSCIASEFFYQQSPQGNPERVVDWQNQFSTKLIQTSLLTPRILLCDFTTKMFYFILYLARLILSTLLIEYEHLWHRKCFKIIR